MIARWTTFWHKLLSHRMPCTLLESFKVSKQRFEELLESEMVHFARALRPHPVCPPCFHMFCLFLKTLLHWWCSYATAASAASAAWAADDTSTNPASHGSRCPADLSFGGMENRFSWIVIVMWLAYNDFQLIPSVYSCFMTFHGVSDSKWSNCSLRCQLNSWKDRCLILFSWLFKGWKWWDGLAAGAANSVCSTCSAGWGAIFTVNLYTWR